MYAKLWKALPGHRWVKVALIVGALLALLFVLDRWVFPWAANLLWFGEATVGR
ncbi:MAG: hypothetical protein WAV45_10395 [Propionibacteriaceae bacterium]|nr:hypothetical protein [Micropruina sp.]